MKLELQEIDAPLPGQVDALDSDQADAEGPFKHDRPPLQPLQSDAELARPRLPPHITLQSTDDEPRPLASKE